MSSEAMPDKVARRLGYALKRAQHALRLNMDAALRTVPLTMPQYAVLCAIEAERGLSNARLARAAFVSAQTMQGILANLERDGLIRRPPDPSHGKILRNELTDRGRKLLAKAHVAARVVEERMVASFGEKAADQLADALSKCAEDLTAALGRVAEVALV
jgi:DNA-binding MarR family transcriptional regulator